MICKLYKELRNIHVYFSSSWLIGVGFICICFTYKQDLVQRKVHSAQVAEQRSSALQKEIEALRAQVTEKESQISQWELDIQRLIQSHQEQLRAMSDQPQPAAGASNQQLRLAEEKLKEVTETLASKVQAIDILKEDLRTRNEALEEKEGRVKELEERLGATVEEVKTLKSGKDESADGSGESEEKGKKADSKGAEAKMIRLKAQATAKIKALEKKLQDLQQVFTNAKL